MVERAFARVPRDELYAATGIQTMPINTVFQLLADEGTPALDAARADRARPRPARLLAERRAGQRDHRRLAPPACSTRATGAWARGLIERLGLPTRPFGALVEPGTPLGPLLAPPRLDAPRSCAPSPRTTPPRPSPPRRCVDEHAAILSSGTWSLLGLELPRARARPAPPRNLTNERGVDGTIRLLKNVMGLWLEQECAARGADAATTTSCTASRPRRRPTSPLFDPDDEALPARRATCRRGSPRLRAAGQRPPATRGEIGALDLRLARLQVPPRAASSLERVDRSRRAHAST